MTARPGDTVTLAAIRRTGARLALLSGCLVAGAPGCRKEPDVIPPPAAADTTLLSALRSQVFGLIGVPTCRDLSQCRLIAYGSKPCGGPWTYLVYSLATTDSIALNAAVEKYNAQEAEVNRTEGRRSDCRAITRPQLQVVAGRCAIQP